MNTRIENKVSMYYKVLTFLQTHLSELQPTNPAVATLYQQYQDLLKQIEQAAGISMENIKGYTLQKQEQKNKLVQCALELASPIKAYALMQHNATLADQVSFTKTRLKRLVPGELLFQCKQLEKLALSLQTELGNIPQYTTLLQQLSSYQQQYEQSIVSKTTQVTCKHEAHQHLKMLMQSTHQHLIILDSMMELIRFTTPMLYMNYRNQRNIDL